MDPALNQEQALAHARELAERGLRVGQIMYLTGLHKRSVQHVVKQHGTGPTAGRSRAYHTMLRAPATHMLASSFLQEITTQLVLVPAPRLQAVHVIAAISRLRVRVLDSPDPIDWERLTEVALAYEHHLVGMVNCSACGTAYAVPRLGPAPPCPLCRTVTDFMRTQERGAPMRFRPFTEAEAKQRFHQLNGHPLDATAAEATATAPVEPVRARTERWPKAG